MSDTPRTDDQIGYDGSTMSAIRIEFCRQLERELNAANDRIQRLEEELMDTKNKHAVLVADVVLNEDRADRIKRLEEAGDAMYLNGCYNEESRAWLREREAKL